MTTVTIIDNDVEIGFEQVTYTVDESSGTVEFTVKVFNGSLGRSVTLTYETTDDTARAGEDYTLLSNTLTLSSESAAMTFTVSITDDTLFETDELFSVSLSGAPTGVILIADTVEVTIEDNETATIGFVQTSYEILENGGRQAVEVEIKSGVLAEGVILSVGVSTADGTATAPGDYIATDDTIDFSSANTRGSIVVPINFDQISEGKERFEVALNLLSDSTLAGRVTVEPLTATVTITDELVTVGFVNSPYVVKEGAAGISVTIGILSEGIVLGKGITLAVNYEISDESASAGQDYQNISGTVVFEAATKTQVVFIPITDDSLFEGDESFRITLTDVEASIDGVSLGDDAPTVQLNPKTAKVTILDDDTVEIGFDPVTYVVSEASGTVTLTARILSGSLGRVVTLTYATADGSAVAGTDYTLTTGTLTLSDTTTSFTFTVRILEDIDVELAQTFTVSLSGAPAGVALTSSVAIVTILDNDEAPIPVVEVGFDPVSYVVDEDSGTVELTVSVLSGVLMETITLSYAVSDVSTTVSDDYTVTVAMLELSLMTTSVTISVDIIDDTSDEPEEEFTFTLLDAPVGVSFNPTVATVTIVDNDAAVDPDPVVIGFDSATYRVNEGSGTVELTVSVLSGVLTETLRLSYAVSDVSTTVSDDYTVTVAMLELSLMTTSVTISVDIIDDTSDEPEEEFTFTLLDAPVGISFNPTAATVTIVDNDEAPAPVDVEIGFDSATYRVNEGSGTVELTVSVLSGVLTETLRLSYAVSDVSTTVSDDYTVTVAMLELSLMTTSVTISVDIIDDTSDEPEEEFTFTLLDAPVGVSFNPTVATVTIVDNDVAVDPDPVVVGFDSATYRVNEGSGTVDLTVSVLSGVLTETLRLSYAVSDVSTTVSDDYTVTVAMLELSLMTTSVTISVDIIDDTSDEPEEEFTVTLLDAPVGISFNPTAATVTIVDNDEAPAPVDVEIGFDSATYRVNEGSGTVELTVSVLSGVLTETLRLNYAVSDVSTTVSDDYTVTVAMLELSLMTTSVTISVDIIDDTSDEPEEEFTFTLLDAPVGISFNPTVATVTIVDNDEAPDPVVVGFDSATYRVNEGSGTVELTVSVLSGVLTETLRLSYAVSDVSTTVSDDYTVTVAMLELSLMTTSVTISVDIIDDTSDEPEEEFTFTLLDAPVGVSFNPTVATVTIVDNDVAVDPDPVVVGFDSATYRVNEGSGTVELTVSVLSGVLTEALRLSYAVSDVSTTVSDDYTVTVAMLELSLMTTSVTISVDIIDDTSDEPEEEFTFTLLDAPVGISFNPTAATVTIVDNDEAPDPVVIGFDSATYRVNEDSGTVELTVSVLSGVLTEALRLSYAVSDVSATVSDDYTVTVAMLELSLMTTSVTIIVDIIDDTSDEPEEEFTFTLLDAPVGISFNPTVATVTIVDNDEAPDPVVIGFDSATYRVNEGSGTVELTVSVISGVLTETLRLSYAVSDVSATVSDDYTVTVAMLELSLMTTSVTISVDIIDDTSDEPEEEFTFTLLDAPVGISFNPTAATVTIVDNDEAPEPVGIEIGFDSATYRVNEGSGTVDLTVSVLSGVLTEAIRLSYAVSDVSTTVSDDYTVTVAMLELSLMTTSVTISVDIIDDTSDEPEEEFTFTLLDAPVGVSFNPTVATVTIVDNDEAPDPVVIGFDSATYRVNEGSGTVELTVSVLSGMLTEAIKLSYAVSDVSTTVSDDYTVTVAMLELSLMTTSVTISVDIIDDTSDEPEEEFTFTLLDAPVGVSFNPTVATVTIVDNDEAPAPVDVEIGFDSATYRVNEGSGTVELTVSVLSGVLTETLRLSYAVSDVSTTVSDDYTVTVAMLELSLMTSSVTIIVDIIDDTSDEPEEEFTVTLLDAPVGISFNPTVATVTIVDNDEAPDPVVIGFDSATYRVNEGSGTVELTVSVISGVLTETLRLSYAVSDVSTTVSDDYTVTVAMLELSLMTTSVTISVDIIDDTSDEPEEEFTVTLLDAPVGISFNPTVATVTIVDNDEAPEPVGIEIGFDSATYRVNEGSGTVELTVSVLSGVLTETLRLSYAVSDVSTTVSDDYTVTVAMLELSLMTTSVTIIVDIIDDTSDEPEEEFTFTLLDAPVGISFNPTVATVTIVDNDAAVDPDPVVVGFDPVSYVVDEDSGTVELTVSVLSGVLMETITLSYAVSDVSTTVSDDYTVTVAMLELSLMTTSVTISVDIIDDTSDEPEEEFTFTLLDAPVGISFNPTVATVTIVDNDEAPAPVDVEIGFDSATYRVNEGSGTVELTVSVLSGVLTEAIRLSYAVSDVSTTVSDDYTVTVAMLELSLMTTSVTIIVDIIDDTSDEPEEEFTFTLLDAPVGVSFNPTAATVTIVDNDAAVAPDPVVIGFDSATYRVNEGSGTVELTVSVLSGVLTEAIRLSYAVSDVSTTVSDDYTVTVNMLELSLMTSSVTIIVDIIDDTSDEPEEEFTFTLLDAPVGISFNPTAATVTIVDNDAAVAPDPVVIGFDPATYRVNEGSGTVELTVSVLSGVLTETLRLSYAVSDVSTTVSDDYTVTVAMLELSLMTTSVTIIVDIIDDTSDESEEEFTFTLLDAPVGISFNPTVATVTIVDNDEAPGTVGIEVGFDSATYRVNEGSGTVELTVSVLSGVLTEAIRLSYAVSDVSTTVSDDYTVTVAMLELSLMTTSVTISVDIIDDTSDESEEEFTFTLLDAPVGISFNPTVATVTIVDNDEAPGPVVIGFDSATYRVNEGSGTVELTVSVLSGVLTEAIRLSYAVSDVSTTVSDDYTVTVNMLELSLMTSSVTIIVDIIDDTSLESEEEFTFTLLDAPVGISFNPTAATVTIVDNDVAAAPDPVVIGFDSATYRVNEGSGTVELTVSVLSGVLTETLRLSYAVSDVSTTVSDDYTVTVAMLELSLMTTSVTISVDIIDDTSDESEEEFTFTLLDAPVGISFNPTVATVTIVDNDEAPGPVVIGFDSATYRVNEGSGTVELTVSVLSGVLTEAIRLSYAVSDVSTTVSDDYTVTVNMLELSLMTSSVTIIVDIIDDTSLESEEEFTFTLLDAPVGISFNPTAATVTIVDNDVAAAPDPVVIGFDSATYRVNEGSGTVELTVSVLSGVLTETLRLSYAVSDVSTTVSDDYTVTVNMLELSLLTTSVTINVDIIDDTSDEPEEEFTFTLLDAPVGISFNPTVATVTIVDNDEAPGTVGIVVGFDSATYRVNEGSGTVELTVSVLSGVLTETLRLSYAVSDVSTTVSDDYTVTVNMLELSLMTTSVTIIVDIIDDTSLESEEEFTFTLLDAPVGVSFNPTAATVTIVDNDAAVAPDPVVIGFDSAMYRVNEGSGTVELTVSVISGVLTETLRLSYAVSDVSTTVSDDYTVTVAMLDLSLMTSSITISVDIIDDTSDESEEEFTVTLLDAPVGVSFNPTAATVTIVDNDEAPEPVGIEIGFDSATYRVNEGSGTVELTVSVLSGVLTETLRLSYAVSDVSTTVSDDYTVTVNMLELSLMTTSVTISVDIIDDTSDEPEEEFTFTLLDAPVGVSFNPTAATVTIVDNDEAPEPVGIEIGFDSATYRVNEGSGTVELTVSVLSGVLMETITLSYAVSDVSTTVSDDYTVTVAMLELSLMTTSVTIIVDIIDDTSDEPEEEFTFTLLDAPVGISFNPTVATVTIVDNDEAPEACPVWLVLTPRRIV